MTDTDPLDEMLRRAFAAERTALPPGRVVERVMGRIRRQRRQRAAVLSLAAATGVAFAARFAGPALVGLGTRFELELPTLVPTGDGTALVTAATLAVIALGLAMLFDEEYGAL